jgi:restriction system protein
VSKPKHAWMVRAGNDNTLADKVELNGAVAIGWNEMGNLSDLENRAQFKIRYAEANPEDKPGRVPVNAGQVYRFAKEINEGDYILTYYQSSRELIIGTATGRYEFAPLLFNKDYPHIRRVNWLKRISRDVFSVAARNSMGSILTVFSLDDHIDEIHRVTLGQKLPLDPPEDSEVEADPSLYYKDVKSKSDGLISDLVSNMDEYDFQDLVAAVLRAIGFRAISSNPGRDKGIDIIAYSDRLGIQTPRIIGQAKRQKQTISGPEMRSFIGTLRNDDRGIYVCTGGFTKDAIDEARNAQRPVSIFDLAAFIELLLENYELLEPEFRVLIPLRRVWIPAKA